MSSFRRMLARLKAHIDDTSAHQGVNLTASRAVVTNALGNLSASSTTSTEIGYVNGVTSAIQTQLDSKQATITGGATTIDTEDLTFDRALISSASGKVAVSVTSATELSYVDGVTSAIQTQLDAKASSTHNHTTANLTGFQTVSGRLTLASLGAMTLVDQLAKTTIYFTPYKGDRIAIYDGSLWNIMTFAEISVSVPATTNTPFDIFAYNNGGTLALETTNWTNDTTRATALVLQDGVYVRSGGTTRRYIGTGRTTGVSGQCEDSLAKRFLWNYYNRVDRYMERNEATEHTYTTASFRQWNNAALTKAEFIVGIVEDPILAFGSVRMFTLAGSSVRWVNIGFNSQTVRMNAASNGQDDVALYVLNANPDYAGMTHGVEFPTIGYNYLNIIEYGNSETTYSWATLHGTVKG